MKIGQVVKRLTDNQIGHIVNMRDNIVLFWPWDGSGHTMNIEAELDTNPKLDNEYSKHSYYGHVKKNTDWHKQLFGTRQ